MISVALGLLLVLLHLKQIVPIRWEPMTQSSSEVPDEISNDFEALRKELGADAMFAATGETGSDGAVTIGPKLFSYLVTDEFVAGYKPLAKHDVVGILFAADPRIVECISASQYTSDPLCEIPREDMKKRKDIQKYLRDAGYEFLLLAGLRSARFGLAWIVAYRAQERGQFTKAEIETARYVAPGLLYKALQTRNPAVNLRAEPSSNTEISGPSEANVGEVVPLSPKGLRIAILEAQGYGPTAIGERVFKATQAVSNDLSNIRRRLGVVDRKVTWRDLEQYAEQLALERTGA